jgi:glycosyltransferase involved in cell wall biosynthesis
MDSADLEHLKILQVTPFFPPSIGGIASLVYNLCNSLGKLGIDIHIITSKGNNIVQTAVDNTARKIQLTEIKSIYFPGWPYPTLRNFSIPRDFGIKIDSIIKNSAFDIVHVHGHHYPICWLAVRSAHRHKIPTVLSLHGTYALNPKTLGGKSPLEDLFNKYIFRNFLSKCDLVIGGTNQVIEYAQNYSSHHDKFRIVPNGVNTQDYINNLLRKKEYRSKYHIDQEKIVLLFVGRFDESKGALEFARAIKLLFQYHDAFEVVIVGKGNLEPEIRTCLKGLEHINIINWQPADKIHEIYIASDIYILPSKFEGLPLSIIEAMNANLYIIFSNVGGVRDILQGYSKKSMLIDSTPEEISKTIIDVYNRNSNNVVDNKSLSYAQTFDWSTIAKNVSLIYKELMCLKA